MIMYKFLEVPHVLYVWYHVYCYKEKVKESLENAFTTVICLNFLFYLYFLKFNLKCISYMLDIN